MYILLHFYIDIYAPLVTKPGHLACARTQFATLPNTIFLNPVLPREPITIKSTLLFRLIQLDTERIKH